MKVVMITDTHFGCKGGSRTWYNSQANFIYKQLLPQLKELSAQDEVVLIHLGDVFDSRSSLNTMIATDVRKMFAELAGVVSKFYVIPGNHDYFSEQTDEYCTVNLVLGGIDNLQIVNVVTYDELDGTKVALVPWHAQKETPMSEFTEQHRDCVVFTHADIITGSPKLTTDVYSGHVHTPYINGKYHNLGSCFPLDFHDFNQKRYFYIWDPNSNLLSRAANDHSIRFWRMKDEDILNWDMKLVGKDDYIELYVSASLMTMQEYQSCLELIKKQFKNVWVIPVPETLINEGVDINCDIESIIEQSIPEDLKDKFNHIKEILYGSVADNGK